MIISEGVFEKFQNRGIEIAFIFHKMKGFL